jgi:hypothetical protein
VRLAARKRFCQPEHLVAVSGGVEHELVRRYRFDVGF